MPMTGMSTSNRSFLIVVVYFGVTWTIDKRLGGCSAALWGQAGLLAGEVGFLWIEVR